MQNQFSFPIFLSLQNKICLVIGFGRVGARKLNGLLSSNPRSILVLDLAPREALPQNKQVLLEDGRVRYECRPWTMTDISSSFLVFATTGSKEENGKIARLCTEAGILCNSASNPDEGSFIIPAHATKNNACMAICTGGASPALAKKWLEEQNIWLESKASFASFMGKLRKIILKTGEKSDLNAVFFHKIVNSPFEEWFISGKLDRCLAWLQQELPSDIYYEAKEILYDLP